MGDKYSETLNYVRLGRRKRKDQIKICIVDTLEVISAKNRRVI